ncbi:glycosyltransferase [Paenibacillus timonensis]|uniref:Glycosyltransferase n=2 Tax=Paenibacillus TaxID=44249 RepID=A0ABW3SA72_9BACL|nr:glycosyltransferase [Paenibacillus timonensis]
MHNILEDALNKKKWSYKKDLYSQVFHSIEFTRPCEKPDISIVVISWRLHEDTILNFISLEKQRQYSNFEIIFVDNGGADGEFEILKPYINSYIKLNENTGAYIARNIGAVFSKAPIVLFLEDDGIPDDDLIISHILAHRRYVTHAVTGVCLFKTENPLNERQKHYYRGEEFYPCFSELEGNTSYSSEVFFSVGGWDDEINFGGGGKELAIRLYWFSRDFSKQVYSPLSIIYHDYALNEEHLKKKNEKQKRSYARLEKKYREWSSFRDQWIPFWGRENFLIESEQWKDNSNNIQNQFMEIQTRVKERNEMDIKKYMRGKIFLTDSKAFLNLAINHHSEIKYTIFGAGSYGSVVMHKLQDYGIRIDSFVDNNPSIWGTTIEGLPVIPPQKISSDTFLFVASNWHYEIKKQLLEMGLREDVNFKIII